MDIDSITGKNVQDEKILKIYYIYRVKKSKKLIPRILENQIQKQALQ